MIHERGTEIHRSKPAKTEQPKTTISTYTITHSNCTEPKFIKTQQSELFTHNPTINPNRPSLRPINQNSIETRNQNTHINTTFKHQTHEFKTNQNCTTLKLKPCHINTIDEPKPARTRVEPINNTHADSNKSRPSIIKSNQFRNRNQKRRKR